MDKQKTLALGAALASAVLAFVGCGGSSSDSSSSVASTGSSSSGTKAAFVKEADAICSEVGKRTEAEYESFTKEKAIPSGKTPSSTQYAEVGENILIPALRQQIGEIEALKAPPNDQVLIGEFLDEGNAAIKVAEEDPQKAAESPSKLLAKADQLIVKYGFKVCGNRQ